MRAAAVALRSPDFEVAAAAGRAPVQVPIGTECGVPVVRCIVGDLAKFAGGRRDHPQVEVPRTIGGEQNPAAVWRVDRLSIGLSALRQAARCGVRPLGDVLTHGLRLDDDAVAVDDREAPQRVRTRVQEPCSRTRLQRHEAPGRARELAGRHLTNRVQQVPVRRPFRHPGSSALTGGHQRLQCAAVHIGAVDREGASPNGCLGEDNPPAVGRPSRRDHAGGDASHFARAASVRAGDHDSAGGNLPRRGRILPREHDVAAVGGPRRVQAIVNETARLAPEERDAEEREVGPGPATEEQRRAVGREPRQVVVGPLGERDLRARGQLLQPDSPLAVALGPEGDRAPVGRGRRREVVARSTSGSGRPAAVPRLGDANCR